MTVAEWWSEWWARVSRGKCEMCECRGEWWARVEGIWRSAAGDIYVVSMERRTRVGFDSF